MYTLLSRRRSLSLQKNLQGRIRAEELYGSTRLNGTFNVSIPCNSLDEKGYPKVNTKIALAETFSTGKITKVQHTDNPKVIFVITKEGRFQLNIE